MRIFGEAPAFGVCSPHLELGWAMKHLRIGALLLVAVTPAFAQQAKEAAPAASDPVVSAVRQMYDRYAKNLIGAADKMPADKYGYRPTPEQMTFAHLMTHVAEANNGLCAFIAGQQPQESKLSESDPKDKLAAAVKDSFTYCNQVLSKADDSNLGEKVTLSGGQTGTRAALLVRLVAGWADHYSAAAMYLRLNGLLPPSAEKK